MCASYGLDPRFKDTEAILADDQQFLDELRSLAVQNNGETLLPAGKILRNLNSIIGGRLIDAPPTLADRRSTHSCSLAIKMRPAGHTQVMTLQDRSRR